MTPLRAFGPLFCDGPDWEGLEVHVRRRRFDHLSLELSVHLGCAVRRYALWLRVHAVGMDPEGLSRRDALRFCDDHLPAFLAEEGHTLSGRSRRSLRRSLSRFDAGVRTPEEWATGLGDPS